MSDSPISEPKRTIRPAKFLIGIGVIVAVLGGFIAWLNILGPYMLHLRAQAWEETPCEIVTANLRENSGEDGSTWCAEFTYAYQIDRAEYTGTRTRLQSRWSNLRTADKEIKAMPPGARTSCWFDPARPGEAVLDRTFSWAHAMPEGIAVTIMMIVGLGLFTGGVYTQRSTKAADVLKSPMASSLVNMLGDEDAKDIAADVPKQLASLHNRKYTLIATGAFGLIWNVFIGSFALGMINANQPLRGFGDWFLILFMIPFFAVGIGLIIGFVMSLLALFNPRVTVALSSGAVAPGDELEIAWQTQGGWSRLKELKIFVVATEIAKFVQGTDTKTFETVFEIIPVVSTEQPDSIRFGSTLIEVPAATMHTFEADNNRILWTVHVHGVIPWWPDVREDYEFRVMPSRRTEIVTADEAVTS